MSSFRRRSAAVLALAALAFAQLAVSAYACPKGLEGSVQVQAPVEPQAGACPEAVTANLCERHCEYGSISVATHAAPFAGPDLALLPWSFTVLAIEDPTLHAPVRHLARTTAPPASTRLTPLRI